MTTKQRCRRLRQQGYSIGQIAHALELSESTVHWHVKGIRLTNAQRMRLRRQKHDLMARLNARRRGIPLRRVLFKKPSWSGPLVHLMAHLAFDGRVDRYGCHYYSRSQSQVMHVQQLLRHLLDITSRVKQRSNGMWIVSFYNVEVAAWLSQKERELLRVTKRRETWRRQWLQALFDDEGHVHVSGHTRRVRASQDDPRVLRQARRYLEAMHIRSRIDQAARAVEITGLSNLKTFRRRINFSSGLRINPDRKNGLWRQPFEKRELLDRALDSY